MEICIKEWPVARNHYGSTEDTEGTELYTSIGRMITKIFKSNLDYNAQQYVTLQEGFIGDRIGDARNLNYNLKLESRNSKH